MCCFHMDIDSQSGLNKTNSFLRWYGKWYWHNGVQIRKGLHHLFNEFLNREKQVRVAVFHFHKSGIYQCAKDNKGTSEAQELMSHSKLAYPGNSSPSFVKILYFLK